MRGKGWDKVEIGHLERLGFFIGLHNELADKFGKLEPSKSFDRAANLLPNPIPHSTSAMP